MSTLEEFQSDISEYLLILKARNGIDTASQSTRDKWQKVFEKIVLVLIQHGHETPDEKDYEKYRANNTMSNETFKKYKEKMNEFFSWRQKRRQETMPDEKIEVSTKNETVIDTETAESEKEIATDAEPSQVTEKVESDTVEAESLETESDKKKSNAGRKKIDTMKGEKRDQKLMLYLTPSVIADVRDWCSLKNLSSNDYITKLIEADLQDKQEKLSFFRQLRDEA